MGTDRTFELTPELVKLLRHSYVSRHLSDAEYGAAEIDPKRPYGNSDVEQDIADLLDLPWADDGDDESANDDLREHCMELHKQTPQALQVVLASGGFTPGIYRASAYGIDWELVHPTWTR